MTNRPRHYKTRRPPPKPTRADVQRAIDAFAPPGVTVTMKKPQRRTAHDDEIDDIFGADVVGCDDGGDNH